MELCEKIKQIRKENNLTQHQLADELCLSRTVITKYERGPKVPNLDTIILISNYFNTCIFDEYKNKLKLFILSIRCCIPYLISLILLFVSSISLLSNVIKVNNQYGYNIYNDELKVIYSDYIYIVKNSYSQIDNMNVDKYVTIYSLSTGKEVIVNVYIDNNFICGSMFYLIFFDEKVICDSGVGEYNNEITISHKPFIYPLKDYDESLPYNEQTGECSKILNYYIDLIEKVK